MAGRPLDAVIVVDKPEGMTSAAVVSRVKRALGARRVGHTGTLDPMATGVLPLCIGEATKVAGYLLASDKAYCGELELGIETDTLDREGQVVARSCRAADAVTLDQLKVAAATFVGAIEQVPPMYSAVRVKGRRLHQLARQGRQVEREPRRVRVDAFEVTELSERRARFVVRCSKGTYVRGLVSDVGGVLGCGAHLTALRRTQAGQFRLEQAIDLESLETAGLDQLAQWAIDPAAAVGHLPCFQVPSEAVRAVRDGRQLAWSSISEAAVPVGPIGLLAAGGGLLALAEVSSGAPGRDPRLTYRRVFTYALT